MEQPRHPALPPGSLACGVGVAWPYMVWDRLLAPASWEPSSTREVRRPSAVGQCVEEASTSDRGLYSREHVATHGRTRQMAHPLLHPIVSLGFTAPPCFRMGIVGSGVLVSSLATVLLVNAAGHLPTQALGWEVRPRPRRAGTASRSLCGLSTTGQGTNNTPAVRSALGESVADQERDVGDGNGQDTGPEPSPPGLGRGRAQRAHETGQGAEEQGRRPRGRTRGEPGTAAGAAAGVPAGEGSVGTGTSPAAAAGTDARLGPGPAAQPGHARPQGAPALPCAVLAGRRCSRPRKQGPWEEAGVA